MAGKRGNGENSIYQSGGRWHVQGFVAGRRRRVSRKKRADALVAWQSLVAESQSQGELRKDGPELATVGDALEHWFSLRARNWRPTTSTGYRHAISAHIAPLLGHHPVNRLTVEHVESWQEGMLARGLSPSTTRQARIVLRQCMDMMVRYGNVASNPVLVAAPLPRNAKKASPLTMDEAARVLAAARSDSERARWLIALTLGLRCGEVLGLRWCDILFAEESPRIVLSEALQYRPGQGLQRVPVKSANSRRTVLLNREHVEVLKRVREEHVKRQLMEAVEYNPEGYVFVTSRGTPFDPNNDAKRWESLLERAGVRKVRRHDARHSAATLLLEGGAPMAQVQKLLGHSSITTTVDVYGHVKAADAAEYTAAVTSRLFAPGS
ncbi:site-specific integrase [Phycicoccus sp. HDW14]|uniref:tyrosine-type recombinase/integrase n=1 Tax=Phycicoccus sp. HDW14 TaxID=2714941 RepID=UPI00140D9727|nr:site-specific integrase [Phycicoccus sp. HDW14]QIM22143.1 site-specific integrase [Phycicoccus sp. HDW14]